MMQTFYHGSHKLFDKFDLSHALEGDGKVKFGFGVYVTSKYESAVHYSASNKNRPELPWCGKGLYELKRNGKCSIIDVNLKPITPSIYDSIGNFDQNGLCLVKIGDRCGMVNKRGEEQIPLIYDQIKENGCLYEVILNGEEFTIDEFGNKKNK